MNRPTWDELFMTQAIVTAKRSTCKRLKVGAVITQNNQIISSGYNGAISGEPHCIDHDCLIEDGHCIRTIHAEINAILQCARAGSSTNAATLYVTHFPCVRCMPTIIQAGIKQIKYLHHYHDHWYAKELVERHHIKCEQLHLDIQKLLVDD